MLPTIAEVLAMPSVAVGDPVVVTGVDALDRPVRWVHVAPPSGGQRLLLGGELLLATGVGWPSQPAALRTYVEELASADIAGLVLELGNRYEQPPGELVTACEALALPLVVLRREVRFVSITQAVHLRILDSQSSALRERDHIHGVFADLNRRGCSAAFLLDVAARMLERPIVLEDLNHHAVAWSTLGREPATLLADWSTQSRRAAQLSVDCPSPYERTRCWSDGGWLRTSVEAQGQRWGTLVALDCFDVPETAEVILESAALALSLGRLSGAATHEWATLAQRHLMESLLTGSYLSLSDLEQSFEAAGLRVRNRDLVAVASRSTGRVAELLQRARSRAEGLAVDVLCGPWVDEPRTAALFVVSARRGRADLEQAILGLLGETASSRSAPDAAVVAVGGVVQSLGDLLRSVDEAVALLQSTPLPASGRTVVHRSRTGALAMLLNRKRDDPDVQAYVERVLGPLLAHDMEHGTDLMALARACVQHPTNRKRAAESCHVSRSVFYQRLKVVEKLLGVDLDDGRTLAALHVALLAYGQRSIPS